MTAPPPAIVVENLSKTFADLKAVDNVSFSIPRGETVGLLGGNGAGKTTTISMILGLVIPTAGTISVLGHSMATSSHLARRRMNFESPYVDMPKRLTVRENLTVYARLYSVPKPRHRIEKLAADLELTDLLDREFGTLSAGQKTRAGLAKAFINQPDVLLLDEPTASLDPDTADWVRSYLESYLAQHNASILLASHNMAEVERLCSHVLMMVQGRIVDAGRPQDLIDHYGRENLEEVFLDIARGQATVAPVMQ